MGDNALHGPEVGTKCLSKSIVSHPQVKWDLRREEGHVLGGLMISRR